jgi:hypothetical protein
MSAARPFDLVKLGISGNGQRYQASAMRVTARSRSTTFSRIRLQDALSGHMQRLSRPKMYWREVEYGLLYGFDCGVRVER